MAKDGNHKPLAGVGGNTDVNVLFSNNLALFHIQRYVKLREFFQGGCSRLYGKNGQGEATAQFFDGFLVAPTQIFQPSDIDIILARNMWNLRPGQSHLPGGGFPDRSQGQDVNRTPF